MRLRLLLPLLAAAGLAAAGAQGGTIRLEARVTAQREGDLAVVSLFLRNLGDESALHVEADLRAGTARERVPWAVPLAPGGELSDYVPLDLPSSNGVPFAVVTVRYTDAAGYPFSTVQVVALRPKSAAADELAAALEPVALRGERGTVHVSLRALRGGARDVRVRLWCPEEFSVERPEQHLLVYPGVKRLATFKVRNHSARSGSEYPVVATLEYDGADGRRTEWAEGRVRVGRFEQSGADRVAALWPWLAGVLLALWVAAQWPWRFPGRGKASERAQRPAPTEEPVRDRGGGPLCPPIFRDRRSEGHERVRTPAPTGGAWVEAAVLAAVWSFLLAFFSPSLLLLDTTLTGGDTPAHNYLASHLRASLFGEGRLVSWAHGWWGGFPMFQFYFTLPYLLAAVGDLVLPFNVALKLVSVLGVFLLPLAAYALGRLLRLPRPTPALMAVAAVPALFVRSHLMWGVNLHSTLAGMIANSLSFALMLLAIGCAWRDADDGRFRLRTVALLAALIASHFFTTVMTGLTLLLVPLLVGRGKALRALRVLAAEGALAALLMAWWLVPLVAKSAYSVDFGTNWGVDLADTLAPFATWLVPFAVVALGLAAWRRVRAAWLFVWMLAAALALFFWGYAVAPVFVNIRLWPFLFFALLALAAIGLGLLLAGSRAPWLVVAATLALALGYHWNEAQRPGDDRRAPPIRPWVQWNYEGMESKPDWPAFEELVLPLRGTAGRLANDLHPENNALGSSRAFEVVPHLTGKPIVEGGIVNSAVGSYLSYYIQGELSQASAGFPTRLAPASYNLTNATAHLRLLNVRHVIARWPVLQQALRESADWRFVRASRGWQLFERRDADAAYVVPLRRQPVVVETGRWLDASLEWLNTPESLDQFFILLEPGQRPPAGLPRWTEAQYRTYLAQQRADGGIGEWLHLGPFRPRTGDPLAERWQEEPGAEPTEGAGSAGRRWRLLFMRGPMDLNRVHPGEKGVVTYEAVNLFLPSAQTAWLRVRVEGKARVWLNGTELTAGGPLRGLREWGLDLEEGRNRLLLKLYRAEGPATFDVRVLALDGSVLPDVLASVENAAPAPGTLGAELPPAGPVLAEDLRDDRIEFRTGAVGVPHLVKVSHYPNWRPRGAAAVYRVTPGLMLVIPERSEVVLRYAALPCDLAGYALTVLGALVFLAVLTTRPVPRWILGRLVSRVAWLKFLDGTLGLALCWLVGLVRFRARREDGPAVAVAPEAVRRILVVRPGGMGDMVLLVPVLRRLLAAFPSAQVDLVCEKRNRDIVALADLPRLSVCLYDSQPWRLMAVLMARRHELAVDTEQFHHFSALMVLASRAPVRVGFKINPGRNLLYTHLVSYDMDGYEGEQFARLLEPLGVAPEPYRLEGALAAVTEALPEALCARAGAPQAAALQEGDRPAGRPLVAVYAGSSTPYKDWGRERFRELVERLVRERNADVVLVGGRGDRRDADWICAQAADHVTALAGRLNLRESAAVLRRSAAFIGGDSGLGHVAVALGIPTVLLFGPSDWRKWAREHGRHAVVRQPTACAPCFIFGYHRLCRSRLCMQRITVEDVLDAFDRVVAT